jgi:hypothetical protein
VVQNKIMNNSISDATQDNTQDDTQDSTSIISVQQTSTTLVRKRARRTVSKYTTRKKIRTT